MKNKHFILIWFLLGVLFILFILGIIMGDPFFIPFFILFGIIVAISIILTAISIIFEHFFPKNRISKILEKIPQWIIDNIQF